MKKILILTLSLVVTVQVFAQTATEEKFRRSSLYTLKLNMPDDNAEHAQALKLMEEAFTKLPVPDAYNDFPLDVKLLDLEKLPEVTADEISVYEKKTGKAGKFLKAAGGSLAGDLASETGIKIKTVNNAEITAKLMKYFNEKKVANNLVAKWHNVPSTPVGQYKWDTDLQTIANLGLVSLSEEEKAQNGKVGLVSLAKDIEQEVVSNTYVVVYRYSFLTGQELFEELSAPIVASLASANALVAAGLNATLEAMKKKYATGYFVRCHAYLFQLEYNDMKEFYDQYWDDAASFANAGYKLTYLGKSEGRARARKADDGNVIAVALQRATDKCYADLQHDWEQFRPFCALHEIDGQLGAYIGTKEGITEKSVFKVYEMAIDKKTNVPAPKEVGSLKIEKGGVWENRAGADDPEMAEGDDDEEVVGDTSRTFTLLKGKPGKFGEGNFIKLAK